MRRRLVKITWQIGEAEVIYDVPLAFRRGWRWTSGADIGEVTLLRGPLVAAKCRSRVNNPLRFGGPDEIYGPTNVLTSARGNLSAGSGRKRGKDVGKVVALFRWPTLATMFWAIRRNKASLFYDRSRPGACHRGTIHRRKREGSGNVLWSGAIKKP